MIHVTAFFRRRSVFFSSLRDGFMQVKPYRKRKGLVICKPKFDEWFNLYCNVSSEDVQYFVSFPELLFYMFTPAQVIFDVHSQVFIVSAFAKSSPTISKFCFFPRNVIRAYLSSASFILFDLTHVAILSTSSWMVK